MNVCESSLLALVSRCRLSRLIMRAIKERKRYLNTSCLYLKTQWTALTILKTQNNRQRKITNWNTKLIITRNWTGLFFLKKQEINFFFLLTAITKNSKILSDSKWISQQGKNTKHNFSLTHPSSYFICLFVCLCVWFFWHDGAEDVHLNRT